MLTLDNLSFNRGERAIFSNLGITFGSGLVCLRGENGSGKTSLLEIIAGILAPHHGIVSFDDNVQSLTYVPHHPCLKADLTVLENISFWARLSQNEILIPTAITYFSLEDYADFECHKLSAGLKKRVDLCRLIVENTKIWLLDEPLVNLDSVNQQRLRNLIATRADQGGLIIATTHTDDFIKGAMIIEMGDFSS